MKSKISFFNKTIFKKNFAHYWPIWTIYFAYLVLILPGNLWKMMKLGFYEGYEETLSRTSIQYLALNHVIGGALNPVPLFLFSAAAVMVVFSYLYTAKNANMIHSLPVNRAELFVTNVLSCVLFLLLPELAAFIIAVFVGIGCGVASIQYLFFWLLFAAGISFFAVSFFTLIAMLTGNIFAMPAYCAIGCYLYVGCVYMISEMIGNICYGISKEQAWQPGKLSILSPLYYLERNIGCRAVWNQSANQVSAVEINGSLPIAGYAAAAVLILIAAYQLYKRRQLEAAGDIVAISMTKPVFRWGAAVFGGFLLANSLIRLFLSADQIKRNFWLLSAGILLLEAVCFWAAEMLMQKNFRVFKKRLVIEWGVTAVVSILILGTFKLDVFGIEKKVPKPEEISRCYIRMDYPIPFLEEEAGEMISIHRQMIGAKEEYLAAVESGAAASQVTFRYYLKSGRVFERSYSVPVEKEYLDDRETPQGRILSMEEDAETLKRHVFGNNYEDNEYYSGYLELYDEEGTYNTYRFSEKELGDIVDAAIKDIEEGNYGRYQFYALYDGYLEEEYFNSISLSYFNKKGIRYEADYYYYYDYSYDGDKMLGESLEQIDYGGTGNVYLNFGKKCTNLLGALEGLGIINEDRKLYTYEEYEGLIGR